MGGAGILLVDLMLPLLGVCIARELGLGGIVGLIAGVLFPLAGAMSALFVTLGEPFNISELLEFLYNSLEFLGELSEFLLEFGLDNPLVHLLALFRSCTLFSKSSWLRLMGILEPDGSPISSKEFLGLITGLGVLSLLIELLGLLNLGVVLPGVWDPSLTGIPVSGVLTGRPDLLDCLAGDLIRIGTSGCLEEGLILSGLSSLATPGDRFVFCFTPGERFLSFRTPGDRFLSCLTPGD